MKKAPLPKQECILVVIPKDLEYEKTPMLKHRSIFMVNYGARNTNTMP